MTICPDVRFNRVANRHFQDAFCRSFNGNFVFKIARTSPNIDSGGNRNVSIWRYRLLGNINNGATAAGKNIGDDSITAAVIINID